MAMITQGGPPPEEVKEARSIASQLHEMYGVTVEEEKFSNAYALHHMKLLKMMLDNYEGKDDE